MKVASVFTFWSTIMPIPQLNSAISSFKRCVRVHTGFAHAEDVVHLPRSFFDKVQSGKLPLSWLTGGPGQIGIWTEQLNRPPEPKPSFQLTELGVHHNDLRELARYLAIETPFHRPAELMISEKLVPTLLRLNKLGLRTIKSNVGISIETNQKLADENAIRFFPKEGTYDTERTYSQRLIKLASMQNPSFVSIGLLGPNSEKVFDVAKSLESDSSRVGVFRKNSLEGFKPSISKLRDSVDEEYRVHLSRLLNLPDELVVYSFHGIEHVNSFIQALCSKYALQRSLTLQQNSP